MEVYQTADTGTTLKFSDGVIAVNPPEKGKKSLTPTVIVYTYPVPVGHWSGPFVPEEGQKIFTGAGEYEKDNLLIRGYGAKTEVRKNAIQTTSWYIKGDDIRVFVLGDVRAKKDVQPTVSEIDEVDVLIFICVDTNETRLSAADVVSIAASLQAKKVVLIGNDERMKKSITKEVGEEESAAGKYVLKKKDLAEQGMTAVHIV